MLNHLNNVKFCLQNSLKACISSVVYVKIAIKVINSVFGYFFAKYVGGIFLTAGTFMLFSEQHKYAVFTFLPLLSSVPVYLCCHFYLSTSAVICTCIPLLSFLPVYLCCFLYLSTVPPILSVSVYIYCCLYLSTSASVPV